MRRVFIHLPKHQLKPDIARDDGFYGKLARAFAAEGHAVTQARRLSIHAHPAYAEPGLHFVHQGLVRSPGVLNTGVAYLVPFWYADPWGLFGESSVAAARFDPGLVPQRAADGFLRRLRARLVEPRRSRYPQPEAPQRFAPGAIAVFLQGPSQPMARAQHMSEPQMVEMILAGAGGRPVLVKPHPRNGDPATLRALEALAPRHPNLQLVDANLHDMLAGAVACCSISSSVGIEAMLHGVPAIQFGRTDFHQNALTLTPGDDFAEAVNRAQATDWPHARFLYWFLQEQMLNMGRDDWFDRLKARLPG